MSTEIEQLTKNSSDPVLIEKAFDFAKSVYQEKRRLSGENYVWHSVRVASVLNEMSLDPTTIAAALLHDVLDEKPASLREITLKEIEKTLGKEIAFLVRKVSELDRIHYSIKSAILREKARFTKEKEENLTGNDVREGLVSIVSIKIKEPQFEGQTKAKLGNTEAKTAVESVFAEAFTEFLEKNPSDARGIIESCMLSARARKAAKAARTTVLRKGVLDGMALPGKLADCSSKAPEDSELYLVEGDSAGGSSKMARDRRFQAILPLRGKVLNVERARLDKILANNEIKNLVIALGAAIAQDFDIEKTRYHRIIIMSDADVDGSHIRTLLLTLFYRYFKPLIERGYLYIAQPPLYKIQAGKCQEYAYTEEDKDEIVLDIDKNKAQKAKEKPLKKEIEEKTLEEGQGESLLEGEAVEGEVKRTGVNVQRYKGLGEMNPEELWETTMSPSNRILLQVNIEDAKQADQMFDILMGKEVLPRKKFIQAHAKKVKNLDI